MWKKRRRYENDTKLRSQGGLPTQARSSLLDTAGLSTPARDDHPAGHCMLPAVTRCNLQMAGTVRAELFLAQIKNTISYKENEKFYQF